MGIDEYGDDGTRFREGLRKDAELLEACSALASVVSTQVKEAGYADTDQLRELYLEARDRVFRLAGSPDLVETIKSHGLEQTNERGKFHCPKCHAFAAYAEPIAVGNRERSWHCFGCAAGGNVFKYIEYLNNLTFEQAVSLLASPIGKPEKDAVNG